MFAGIKDCLDQCMLRDRKVFANRLRRLAQRQRHGEPYEQGLQTLSDAVERSLAQATKRKQLRVTPHYPATLPVAQNKDIIMQAIAEHQVVIVSGETGSGKTTQLPKILLEMGYGVYGVIGHTQPRRIAARSLAKRIAEELGSHLGQLVGCKVRFSDQTSAEGYIKVMTDGMLLAETQSDPDLLAYDALIIDEVHERSLNIDFMLGYLKRLLRKRPELKLIITSATIDPQRYSKHFDDAPLIAVTGRSYPVEIRYHAPEQHENDEDDTKDLQAISRAVFELASLGRGDVLVFLSGEREIRETAKYLRKHHPTHTEILPLYGRLSMAEQNKVFSTHTGRRVVLATNVAETSLTVPGIHYVVDTGKARISRYSYRTKLQRLPIEVISQASANQRSGRCGRVAAGVCIRLYTEEDYLQRPAFTDPEIMRTNLASVILQMLVLRLGAIEDFPFLDAPDSRLISDGYKLLHELGAVDKDNVITALGKRLAKLPIDIRLARMMMAAADMGCLTEVLVIVTGLSIQDPRERPLDYAQQADEKHKPFANPDSDFLAYLNLWNTYHAQKKVLSGNQLRKWCKQNFLSAIRMREWHDVQRQLQNMAKEMQLRFNQQEASYELIHQALLSGLLGNIAYNTEAREYTGARNIKLQIFPGSGLFKKKHKWLMAAELVETGRRYARTVAKIDPLWLETLALHLLKRHYFEPHWEKQAARVMAFERVSLYGLPLVEKRRVNFSAIDPVLSREIFIRAALVNGDYRTRARFFQHNQECIASIELLEAKSRRRDVLVDEEQLYAFYDERIPAGICSGVDFETWRKTKEQEEPRHLYLSQEDLMRHDAAHVTDADFPDHLTVGAMSLALEYDFNPGHELDGVVVKVPLPVLAQLQQDAFDWLVPGLLQDKIVALIKSLPKSLRRHLVPAPDYAATFLRAIDEKNNLLDMLSQYCSKVTNIKIARSDWRPELLEPHFFMSFCLLDGEKVLAKGTDLLLLQEKHQDQVTQTLSDTAVFENYERNALSTWDFPDLVDCIEAQIKGVDMRGYPALTVDDKGIHLRVFASLAAAYTSHRQGLIALYGKACARDLKNIEKNLLDIQQTCLYYSGVGRCEDLKKNIIEVIIIEAFLSGDEIIRKQSLFMARQQQGICELVQISRKLCVWLKASLQEYHVLSKRLKGKIATQHLEAMQDIKEQLNCLIYEGFVKQTSYTRLQHLPRYLQALSIRFDKLEANVQKDRQLALPITVLWDRYINYGTASGEQALLLQEYRWMLEEYRVSVFAQTLKTAMPVSSKRLDKLWAKVIAD